jgi:membrane protein implicated in regulation of membrane protease activity
MPGVDEVPSAFPATTLWDFRVASAGLQLVMWSTISLVFAVAAQRVIERARVESSRPAPARAG